MDILLKNKKLKKKEEKKGTPKGKVKKKEAGLGSRRTLVGAPKPACLGA